MKKNGRYYQGFFHPLNPQKYKGDPTKIVFRSLMEYALMKKFDSDKRILEWSSESTIVPYISPIDGQPHRYFVDMTIKYVNADGKVTKMLIEVKPRNQCKPPKKPKRQGRRYLEECKTWAINNAKWDAATKYAKKYGMEFKIMDEYAIGIKKDKKK